jgi:hypothetical protein
MVNLRIGRRTFCICGIIYSSKNHSEEYFACEKKINTKKQKSLYEDERKLFQFSKELAAKILAFIVIESICKKILRACACIQSFAKDKV